MITVNEVFSLQIGAVLRGTNESENESRRSALRALHLQNDELFKQKLIKLDEYQNNRARINAWERRCR